MCGDANILDFDPGIALIDETYLLRRIGVVFFIYWITLEF